MYLILPSLLVVSQDLSRPIRDSTYLRLQFGHSTHSLLDRYISIGTMHVVKVDTVDTEGFKTFSTSFFAVCPRAVDLMMRHATFPDKSKFGREKDPISFPSPFEPFRQELLTVAIETMKDRRELFGILVKRGLLTQSYPN